MTSFYKDKKVFLTGHTGFKGTWACNVLVFLGAQVSGYALSPPTKPSLFEESCTQKKINSITGDVRDREKLIAALKVQQPDIVFHFAAQPLVRYSYKEPALTYEHNIMGTVNILEAVRQTPSVRSFVNVTTDKVYENKEWAWGYRENENLCGFDPYSNSKSCSELVTYSYRNSFFCNSEAASISTARSGNVIGGGDYSLDRIIPDCIRAAKDGKEIIVRNPHSIRPYQHVLECLYGYLLLAQKQFGAEGKIFEGAYNFGPNEESCITTGKLTDLFCKLWGSVSWKAQENTKSVHEANALKLDCSKAKSVLGWKPHWDINTAVKKTVEAAKTNDAKSRVVVIEKQIKEYFEGL
ncbi:MAG: CDP-glucose 4,6-dehydratase [Termitinemataceae bacterium]|nr:MAG: CDP-glucose 4,6-dehydratase [Termitinemataceae bacterium]